MSQETREFIDSICKEEALKIFTSISKSCLGVIADYNFKDRLIYIVYKIFFLNDLYSFEFNSTLIWKLFIYFYL